MAATATARPALAISVGKPRMAAFVVACNGPLEVVLEGRDVIDAVGGIVIVLKLADVLLADAVPLPRARALSRKFFSVLSPSTLALIAMTIPL